MNERDAFMEAIIESPEDDTPRLMYSDWLKERSDPLGDFIEVQCEFAQKAKKVWCVDRWQYEIDTPEKQELYNRCRDLLKEHKLTWDWNLLEAVNPDVQTFTDSPPWQWNYERGFPTVITKISCESYVRNVEAIHRAAPIQDISVYGWLGLMRILHLAIPPCLRVLRLKGAIRPRDPGTLSSSHVMDLLDGYRKTDPPWWNTLKMLEVRKCPSDSERILLGRLPRVILHLNQDTLVWMPEGEGTTDKGNRRRVGIGEVIV